MSSPCSRARSRAAAWMVMFGVLAWGVLWAPAAQAQSKPTKPAPKPTPTMTEETPAPVRLGLRTKSLKQKIRVRPIVVLVKDVAEFTDAVSAWSLPNDCWPVLIDDGGDLTRENIARFVRAYRPREVVRWSAPSEPWPSDPAAQAERVTKAYFDAWDQPDAQGLKTFWSEGGHTAPGVVVTNTTDPAWPAALVLAAMRGQILSFIDVPRGQPGDLLPPDQLASLLLATEEAARSTGLLWDSTGDDIDALTLCANTPSKIKAIGGGSLEQVMALTDRLARKADAKRWGWAGQIFGDSPTALYRGTCPVFLGIEDAWLFDGYKVGSVPGEYNLRPINEILMNSRYRVALDPARTGAAEFRRATAAGISAGLVFINTKGAMWNFELSPGRLYSFDVPMLNVPAVVHFTHSFSAQVVHHRSAIAGRWLENGAYAYLGSVDEPYLQSFMPGPDCFARFFAYEATFPGAARYEQRPLSKLNYFGDPLIIAGAPPIRLDEVLPEQGPLAGLQGLEAKIKEDLKGGNIEAAAAGLVMLGRDKDAARLCLAAVRTKAGEARPVSDRLGAIGAPAAFRERDPIGTVTLIRSMPARLQADPFYVSLLWQAGRPLLDKDPTPDVLEVLKNNIRELCAKEDLEALTPAVLRVEGKAMAQLMWKGVIERTQDAGSKQELEAAMTTAIKK